MMAAVSVRRWSLFSLRSLPFLIALVALPCSGQTAELRPVQEEQAAVEAIEKLGGEVSYEEEKPAEGGTAKGERFAHVTKVVLSGPHLGDAQLKPALERLSGLSRLQSLDLGGAEITDGSLKHLEGLTRLRSLDLDNTKVTGSGLKYLEGLTQLQELDLWGSKINDSGLIYLKGLTN